MLNSGPSDGCTSMILYVLFMSIFARCALAGTEIHDLFGYECIRER